MTYDTEKRISWDGFFKHPIFEKEKADGSDMKQSVMFRNHEDKVSRLFFENKKEGAKDVELVDPLEIELQAAS